MADFSKQWCELNDPDMPWDFDIEEEGKKLKVDEYIPIICEGFGFLAIGKFVDGIKVYFQNWAAESDEQQGEWVMMDDVLKNNK